MSGTSAYKVTIRRQSHLEAAQQIYGGGGLISEGIIARNFKVGSNNVFKAGTLGVRRLNNAFFQNGTPGSFGVFATVASSGSPSNSVTIRVGRSGSQSLQFLVFGD